MEVWRVSTWRTPTLPLSGMLPICVVKSAWNQKPWSRSTTLRLLPSTAATLSLTAKMPSSL